MAQSYATINARSEDALAFSVLSQRIANITGVVVKQVDLFAAMVAVMALRVEDDGFPELWARLTGEPVK